MQGREEEAGEVAARGVLTQKRRIVSSGNAFEKVTMTE